MASQNVAPPGTQQKSMETATTGSKDGHSVSKRLQKELMALMVSIALGRGLLYECILWNGDDISNF